MIEKESFMVLWGILILAGCDLIDHRTYHDPILKLEKNVYENINTPPDTPLKKPFFCPKNLPVLTRPTLSIEMCKKISVNIQDGLSLRDLLVELGRKTGVGLALSPDTNFEKHGISYSAFQIPFIQIVKDICNLTHHRFQIKENRILIEPDLPYLVTYNLQFLNHTRKSENRISVSTNVFSPMDNKNGTENGSDSLLQGTTHMDFWGELGHNLKMILNPEKPHNTNNASSYSLHKQGGIILVFGTALQHEQVETYLKKLKEAISTQVLIEAKIVEVTLNNEFKSGINWRQLGGMAQLAAPLGAPTSLEQGRHLAQDILAFSIEHEQFSFALNLIKKFGTVRTLCNPRLTVLNNQPAMLKVATNEVFFHLEFDRYFQADGKPDIENISSDPLTIPIGLVMIVQPSINLQTGEITLSLRPTISRVQKEIEDPAVAIKSHQSVKSIIPVVQVRELDSILKIKSGQIVIMGGLMEDRSSNVTASVPLIDSIPFLGEFVKHKDDGHTLTELVIFLTAHIIEDPYIAESDQRIYNTYIEDSRPLQF